MFSLNCFRKRVPRLLLEQQAVFLLAILLLVSSPAHSKAPSPALERLDSTQAVDHLDPIVIDVRLTLPKLIDLTMQKYPDTAWLNSLEEEAAAIAERSKSWTAGASQASIGYQSIASFRLNYATG
ncbi:MAG: TolC family protein, partial [Methylococcaceae bacterium]